MLLNTIGGNCLIWFPSNLKELNYLLFMTLHAINLELICARVLLYRGFWTFQFIYVLNVEIEVSLGPVMLFKSSD